MQKLAFTHGPFTISFLCVSLLLEFSYSGASCSYQNLKIYSRMFKKKSNVTSKTTESDADGKHKVIKETVQVVRSELGTERSTKTVTTTTTAMVTEQDLRALDISDSAIAEMKAGRIFCTDSKEVYTTKSTGTVKATVTDPFKDFDNKSSTTFHSWKPSSKPSASFPKSSEKTNTSPSKPIKPGKFAEDCLKAHNEYRAKHGVPPLKLSKKICSYSQEWADQLGKTDSFEHRKERKYGENIFMKWTSDPNYQVQGHEAVDSWYSEIKDHTFGKEPSSLKSGHFTQVIWRSCKEMGVAFARSKTGKILVVANYDPPGNMIGSFTENVPAPKK